MIARDKKPRPTFRTSEADQLIRTIRNKYAQGVQLRDRQDEDRRQCQDSSDAEDALIDPDPAKDYKTLQFARAYTEVELEELCALRSPRGKPLTWAHVLRCISVADKSQRAELQRLAAENEWSVRELGAEMKRRFGCRRPRSGRPVRRPASAIQGVQRLVCDAETWLRTARKVQSVLVNDGDLIGPSPDGRVTRSFAAFENALRLVQQAVSELESLLDVPQLRSATPLQPVPQRSTCTLRNDAQESRLTGRAMRSAPQRP